MRFSRTAPPDAYERQVDRLLASPRYGERWARRWLDLARYADTNGYEKDRPRSIWPYRDWVIRRIERRSALRPVHDRPARRRHARRQRRLEQKVATGFHRNTMLNEEGGIDPLEFRFYAMTDRVATTATVWLGLTLGCAQCHTHKFDPIPHREYYQFMALLNNADEPEMAVPPPRSPSAAGELAARDRRARPPTLPDRFPIDGKVPTGDAATEATRMRREQLERRFQSWLERASSRRGALDGARASSCDLERTCRI